MYERQHTVQPSNIKARKRGINVMGQIRKKTFGDHKNTNLRFGA